MLQTTTIYFVIEPLLRESETEATRVNPVEAPSYGNMKPGKC